MHRDRQGVAGVFPGNVVHVCSEKSRVPTTYAHEPGILTLPGNVVDVAVLGVRRAIIGLYVSSYTFLHCHTFPG